MSGQDPNPIKTIPCFQCQQYNQYYSINCSHLLVNIDIDIRKNPNKTGMKLENMAFCSERCFIVFAATRLGWDNLLNKMMI